MSLLYLRSSALLTFLLLCTITSTVSGLPYIFRGPWFHLLESPPSDGFSDEIFFSSPSEEHLGPDSRSSHGAWAECNNVRWAPTATGCGENSKYCNWKCDGGRWTHDCCPVDKNLIIMLGTSRGMASKNPVEASGESQVDQQFQNDIKEVKVDANRAKPNLHAKTKSHLDRRNKASKLKNRPSLLDDRDCENCEDQKDYHLSSHYVGR